MTRSASNPAELVKRLLAEPRTPPLLGILSPEEVRRERIINLFVDKQLGGEAVPPQNVAPIPQPGDQKQLRNSFDHCRLDGRLLGEKDIRLLRDELNSLSLFSTRRLFVIRHADALAADLQRALIEVLSNLSPDNTVIVSGAKLLEASPLKKHLKSKAILIELEEIQGADLARWVEKELKRAGFKSWEQRVVPAVTEIGDSSPDLIIKDIEHLRLYADGDTLRLGDVEQVFMQRTTAGEFAVIDQIVQGRVVQAEAGVTQVLRSGKNAFMFLGLLAKTFGSYLAVKSLLESGQTPARAGQELKMAPWLISKHTAAVAKYSALRLGRCMRAVLRADSKLKNRSLGQEAIFSELFDELGMGGQR